MFISQLLFGQFSLKKIEMYLKSDISSVFGIIKGV